MSRTLNKRPASKVAVLPIQVTRNNIIKKRDVAQTVTQSSLGVLLEKSGATYIPTASDLEKYPLDMIYEMAYGGSHYGYFSSDRFSKYRARETEYLDTFIRNSKVVEGITECPSCGSDRILKVILSIRSGDEPDVNDLTCTKCAFHWRVSK